MAEDRFVNLHRHGEFSFWDGLDKAGRAAARCAAVGQPALALTDHGGVFGLVEHYRACAEVGVKAIMGMEAYVTETDEKVKPSHATVLVESRRGYRNLMRLVERGYERFYYKPRVTLGDLEEMGEGLILLSGCPSGLVGRALLAEEGADPERAEGLLSRMESAFRGRFYVEVQHHERAARTGKFLVAWAKRNRIPYVFTNDAHYVDAEDRAVHDTILKMKSSGKGEEDPTYGEGFHLVTAKEMQRLAWHAHPWMSSAQVEAGTEEAVSLAERCSFDFKKPEEPLPKLWEHPDKMMRKAAWSGLEGRGLEDSAEHRDRLQMELDVVSRKGLGNYFMVIREVTDWAKREGIMVGPRGSVCGSLLAHCLGITMIDPIRHGTLFERFMHDEKVSYPDVDLDFDARHKERVNAFIRERFGDWATPIITFGRYVSFSLANDLAKVFEMGDGDKRRLRDCLEEVRRAWVTTVEDPGALDEFGLDYFDEGYPQLKLCVQKLYGQTRYVGRHPGGVCFAPGDRNRWFARVRVKERDLTSCSFVDVDYLGLVKFDFLGLDAVSVLAMTRDMVRERHGVDLDLEGVPLDDRTVYSQLSKGRTVGIFQVEQRGATEVVKEVEPQSFAELAAAVALNRPGVSDSIPGYVEGKRASMSGREFHPALRETYGALVYQEQTMQILRSLGFSWAETDRFIKSIKGLGSFTIGKTAARRQPEREKLVRVLEERGYSKSKVARVVQLVSGYSFNKGHAVAYALISYLMAWLKENYPLEFWCATLEMESVDPKRFGYERAAGMSGIVFLPPHVNGSAGYSIEGNAIRVGLRTVKGLGETTVQKIVANQPYRRPRDITRIPRREMNVARIRALKEAGALEFKRERQVKQAVHYNQVRTG